MALMQVMFQIQEDLERTYNKETNYEELRTT